MPFISIRSASRYFQRFCKTACKRKGREKSMRSMNPVEHVAPEVSGEKARFTKE